MTHMTSLFLAIFTLTTLASAKTETFKIDATQTKVNWLASKKIGSSHSGAIQLKSGEIVLDNAKLTGGKLVMDMNTIQVTDIPASSADNGKLKGHLESNDFFSVKSNPEATLVIKSVEQSAPSKANITGDLTIKGKTFPVTFPAEITVAKNAVTAKGKITVDRTKYDIKYNSADFFNLPVDKIINNTFEISFEAKAQKM